MMKRIKKVARFFPMKEFDNLIFSWPEPRKCSGSQAATCRASSRSARKTNRGRAGKYG
jgi:hypothetical protein